MADSITCINITDERSKTTVVVFSDIEVKELIR